MVVVGLALAIQGRIWIGRRSSPGQGGLLSISIEQRRPFRRLRLVRQQLWRLFNELPGGFLLSRLISCEFVLMLIIYITVQSTTRYPKPSRKLYTKIRCTRRKSNQSRESAAIPIASLAWEKLTDLSRLWLRDRYWVSRDVAQHPNCHWKRWFKKPWIKNKFWFDLNYILKEST